MANIDITDSLDTNTDGGLESKVNRLIQLVTSNGLNILKNKREILVNTNKIKIIENKIEIIMDKIADLDKRVETLEVKCALGGCT